MWQIKSFVFSAVQENTYVLYNETGGCAIIDPGCYDDDEKTRLNQFISKSGLTPQMLLNTHCHLDHVFGNKYVNDTWGLTLQLHQKEKPVLDFAPASGLMWGLPFDNYQGDMIWLKEGDTIHLGDDELIVLEAPGHSPGHICFYCKKQGFVIGGDVLFKGSIGRTDLPGGNHETLLKSIRTKLLVLPDETVVYSGHGPATTIGDEKLYNPFLS
ncbi:MAG TPA: MBL fold metallo-hydrolase [Ferruginibacter sp.]|nr:MBL fold metallo-hydrolase [Ferruginibacter sp.]HMP19917.1 MBL fold metallo-hydrolase [Ferruginibacter sp.]